MGDVSLVRRELLVPQRDTRDHTEDLRAKRDGVGVVRDDHQTLVIGHVTGC